MASSWDPGQARFTRARVNLFWYVANRTPMLVFGYKWRSSGDCSVSFESGALRHEDRIQNITLLPNIEYDIVSISGTGTHSAHWKTVKVVSRLTLNSRSALTVYFEKWNTSHFRIQFRQQILRRLPYQSSDRVLSVFSVHVGHWRYDGNAFVMVFFLKYLFLCEI